RHEKSSVVEPGFPGVIGLGIGAVLEMHEGDTAGAQGGATFVLVEHRKPKYVAIEGGQAIEITDLEPDGADMQRGAVGESGRGGGVRGVHGALYRHFDQSAQPGGAGLVPLRREMLVCY